MPVVEPIQSAPSHPISLKSVLMLSSHLLSGLFLSGIPTNILYAFLISSMSAACSAHLILFNFITLIIFGIQV